MYQDINQTKSSSVGSFKGLPSIETQLYVNGPIPTGLISILAPQSGSE